MVLIFVITYIMLKKTRLGRYIYAIGGNEEAARLSGINTKKILLSVYVLGWLISWGEWYYYGFPLKFCTTQQVLVLNWIRAQWYWVVQVYLGV